MLASFPDVSMCAVRFLLPFASTYLCDSEFISLIYIKLEHGRRYEDRGVVPPADG